MKQTLFLIIATAIVLPSSFAYAGPIIRTGETISIDASQVLSGDFYGLGGIITISGESKEDAYVAGGTVTVNASVAGDLTVAGGSVQVHAPIGDDVRILGGDVTIAESVQGDVFVVGGLLTILSTATVEGDVIFMGGEVAIEGTVRGNVHGTADRVRVNGDVVGGITVTAASLLTLGDGANVEGGVTYESRNDLVRAQNARVGGEVRKTAPAPVAEKGLLRTYLTAVLMLAFATLSLYFIARNRLVTFVRTTAENPGISGLVGLGVLLMVPFIASVFLVSIIGSILGVTLVLAYALLLALSGVLSGAVLGFFIQKFLFKKSEVTLGGTFAGTALFALLPFVPYVGGLLILASVAVTLGGIGTALYRGIRA